MSGWFAAPASGWATTRARLVRLVERFGPEEAAWEPEEAVTDLRWWHDQERMGRARMPGARALAADWGWTHWRVRQLKKKPAAWMDPRFLEEEVEAPAHLPHARRTPPAQEDATPSALSTSSRTPAAHPPHEPRLTRGDTHSHPQAHPPLKPPPGGARDDADPVGSDPPPQRPGWTVLGPHDEPPPPDPAPPPPDPEPSGPAPGSEGELLEAVVQVLDAYVDEYPEHRYYVVTSAMQQHAGSNVVKLLRQRLPAAGWAGPLDPGVLAQAGREWVGRWSVKQDVQVRGPREPVPQPPAEPARAPRRRRRRKGRSG